MFIIPKQQRGRVTLVGVATCYGLDGLEIDPAGCMDVFVVRCTLKTKKQVRNMYKGRIGKKESPGGDDIFRTCPDRPSLLYNGHRVSFLE
jgi:hypothetical protein